MGSHVFLAIAGGIGSGKTTLTKRLVDRLGYQGLYESTADNPYLADFYSDMERYALPLQLRFLAWRVREIRAVQDAGISAIQDRTCYEDAEIFAAHLHARREMDDRDWETYELIASQLLHDMSAPDLLVYLRRSPESCARQIARRGRSYEQEIPAAYLSDLGARYDDWYEGYARGAKLVVQAEEHDFLNSDDDIERLVERIQEAMPQRQLQF